MKTVCIRKLRKLADPFAVCALWLEFPNEKLSRRDVRAAVIRRDTLHPRGEIRSKSDHIRRIAWFAVHGWRAPISVDVGVPSLGCVPRWAIIDGNHRFAAAIIRGDKTIRAEISGEESILNGLRSE